MGWERIVSVDRSCLILQPSLTSISSVLGGLVVVVYLSACSALSYASVTVYEHSNSPLKPILNKRETNNVPQPEAAAPALLSDTLNCTQSKEMTISVSISCSSWVTLHSGKTRRPGFKPHYIHQWVNPPQPPFRSHLKVSIHRHWHLPLPHLLSHVHMSALRLMTAARRTFLRCFWMELLLDQSASGPFCSSWQTHR